MAAATPKWFSELGDAIDWDAIDRDTQVAFRAQLIDFAKKNIPLKGDNAVIRVKKLGVLEMLKLKVALKK